MTLKNTEVNNGLEPWRGPNATYDSNNKGRQREQMQYVLQPKRAEPILRTTEAVERWECDMRGTRNKRFGKTFGRRRQERCHTCVGTAASSEPLHLNSHILKSYAQGRTMLLDSYRAQADAAAGDAVPMDLPIRRRRRQKTSKAKVTKTRRTEKKGQRQRQSQWQSD